MKAIEEEAKKRKVSGLKKGDTKPVGPRVAQREDSGRSNEKLAEAAGVGKETIRRIKFIRKYGTPEQIAALEGGAPLVKAPPRSPPRGGPRG